MKQIKSTLSQKNILTNNDEEKIKDIFIKHQKNINGIAIFYEEEIKDGFYPDVSQAVFMYPEKLGIIPTDGYSITNKWMIVAPEISPINETVLRKWYKNGLDILLISILLQVFYFITRIAKKKIRIMEGATFVSLIIACMITSVFTIIRIT